MNKLFAVVVKLLSGKYTGDLVTIQMSAKSENELKSLIIKSGMKPVLISQEW